MAPLQRVRVGLTGFAGGPGVSTFYFLDAGAALPALHFLYDSIKGLIPNDVTASIEAQGDIIEETTGTITGTWTGTAPAVVVGTDTGPYAAPVGIAINWLTGTVVGGRRLRGRTYLVPMAATCFDNDGSLLYSAQSLVQGDADAVVTSVASNFSVWHRPRDAAPAWSDVTGRVHAAKPAVIGSSAAVTAGQVKDKVAILRTRRD